MKADEQELNEDDQQEDGPSAIELLREDQSQ